MSQFISQIFKEGTHSSQKTVFMDRDGTLIKLVNYLSDQNQIEILPEVVEALKILNEKNLTIIVITNQPVVARGLATIDEVKQINDKLNELLIERGVNINAIYTCPHHPNADLLEFRVDCDCRKPNTAMFEKAQDDFRIDLSSAYMIGDTERDMLAGKQLGIKTILLGNREVTANIHSDYTCRDLRDAVKIILSN